MFAKSGSSDYDPAVKLVDNIARPGGREQRTGRAAWRVRGPGDRITWAFVRERNGKVWIVGYPEERVDVVDPRVDPVAGAVVGAGTGLLIGGALGGPVGATLGGVLGAFFGAAGGGASGSARRRL